jgi:hypothetical protein
MPSALLATGSFHGTRDKTAEACVLVSVIGQWWWSGSVISEAIEIGHDDHDLQAPIICLSEPDFRHTGRCDAPALRYGHQASFGLWLKPDSC